MKTRSLFLVVFGLFVGACQSNPVPPNPSLETKPVPEKANLVTPHQPKLTRKTVVHLLRLNDRVFIVIEDKQNGFAPNELCQALREHNQKSPDAYYEFESDMKLDASLEQQIRDAFRCAGVRVWRFWLPVGAIPGGLEEREDGKFDFGPS